MSWDSKTKPRSRKLETWATKPYPTPEAGRRFGRLVVLTGKPVMYQVKDGVHIKKYKVRCDCGVEKLVRGTDLWEGSTKSCGCYAREVHNKWGSVMFPYRKRLKSRT